jgi:hypothetical protein
MTEPALKRARELAQQFAVDAKVFVDDFYTGKYGNKRLPDLADWREFYEQRADAWAQEARLENEILRRELALCHPCGQQHLYGDDGELQCGKCHTDFKRDSVQTIEKNLYEAGMARIAALEQRTGEQAGNAQKAVQDR